MEVRQRKPKRGQPYQIFIEAVRFKHPLTKKITKKAKSFRTRSEAIAWKKAMLVEKYQYEHSAHLTFTESVERWKKFLAMARGPGTIQTYTTIATKYLLPYFKDRFINEITRYDVHEFSEKMKEQYGYSANYSDLINRVLQSIVKESYMQGHIDRNPLTNLSKTKKENIKYRYMKKDEIKTLLENQNDDYIDLYNIAINTGMRKGELAGLKWDAIDFDTNLIMVGAVRDQHGFRHHTKGQRIRHIRMNQKVRDILYKLKGRKQQGFVFLNLDKGTPFNTTHINELFSRLLKASGLPEYKFHDMRHTFSTQFLIAGGSLRNLQKILGHASITETERYAHLDVSEIKGVEDYVSF